MNQTQPKQTPIWFEDVPDTLRYQPLAQDTETDIVVVGAGVVGIMTAWYLAEQGRDVVLLERQHVATGDTGYSTAFVTRIPDVPSIADLAGRYGTNFVRKLFAATRAAQDDLRRIIKDNNIACDFLTTDSYFYSLQAEDAMLQKEWPVVHLVEPESAYLQAAALDGHFAGARSAIRFGSEARFDIRKFLIGLLATPTGKRIRVFEETPALAFQIGKKPVVTTPRATIHAQRIILATGTPHNAFPELTQLVTPFITYVLVAAYQKTPLVSDNQFWDTNMPYHYLRHAGTRVLMLGGADRMVKTAGNAENAFTALHAYLAEHLAGTFSVTHQWSGSLFVTDDHLPYVDCHPSFPNTVFFAHGFGGNGIVMGALAGKLLAARLTNKTHNDAEFFSLRRNSVTLRHEPPSTAPVTAQTNIVPYQRQHRVLRVLLPLIPFALFLMQGWVFLSQRGGISFIYNKDLQTTSFLLFPMMGLYAFFFVWMQVLIGSNRDWLQKIFPGIVRFHRTEGVFALFFAVLHPALLFIGVGPAAYIAKTYIAQRLHLYIWLGYFQLMLILLTTGTALLMRLPFIKKYWRWIHFSNYLVFLSVWTHSWFLGTDVQSTPLRYLWFFYGATFVLATIGRIFRGWKPRHHAAEFGAAADEFVAVGPAQAFSENTPHCVTLSGKKLVLVKQKETFFALENTCTHAGGPLCEGTLDGNAIVCPWHASKFDLASGSVLQGPARIPQARYAVRVRDGIVEIQKP